MKKKNQPHNVFEYRDDEFEDVEQNENENDLHISANDFEDMLVAPSDWTIGTLVDLIDNQIKLDPEFQRRGVWSEAAKIRFIESLFLNIPIPQILLAPRKEDKNTFVILDGKQRLLTIKEFWNGKFDTGKPFVLKGLRIIKELNGRKWSDIERLTIWRNRIVNHTQRATVIRGWKSEDVLYEIFHRLNSGSVGLSPMELRTSLHKGNFIRSIIEWTDHPRILHQLLRLRKPDKRMADAELVLRYIAFSEGVVIYKGDLKEFLDETSKILNSRYHDDEVLETIASRLAKMEQAIESAIEIFGEKNVCRKWKDGKFDSRFNRAVFDIVVGSLSDTRVANWAKDHATEFTNAFISCCRDQREFLASLETSTKNLVEVRLRFSTWYGVVAKLTGIHVELPNIAPAK